MSRCPPDSALEAGERRHGTCRKTRTGRAPIHRRTGPSAALEVGPGRGDIDRHRLPDDTQGTPSRPVERSPTGRWYVLVAAPRTGRLAFYVRASPGRDAAAEINRQLQELTHWSGPRQIEPFLVVREIADHLISPLRRLANLLSDREIATIVIERANVVGEPMFALLVATLAAQSRRIVLVNPRSVSRQLVRSELQSSLDSLNPEPDEV